MYTPEKIRELRLSMGLTLAEFGKRLADFGGQEISPSSVCNWEKGKKHPRYKTLVALNELARRHRDAQAGPVLVPQ